MYVHDYYSQKFNKRASGAFLMRVFVVGNANKIWLLLKEKCYYELTEKQIKELIAIIDRMLALIENNRNQLVVNQIRGLLNEIINTI